MDISLSAARGEFTQTLVDVYRETTRPTEFLKSFFKKKETTSKQISIQVMRGTEKVAVDVLRGTEGKRNRVSQSSEKVWIPPYYREYLEATDLDFYDRLFGDDGGTVSGATFAEWVEQIRDALMLCQDKIERSYELQCSQVLEDGIVQLNSGNNIDFKRKAASLVAFNAAHDFADNAIDPGDILESGCEFIRTKGKSQGGVLNCIMGSTALRTFLNHTIVKEKGDLRRISLIDIRGPQANAVGGVLHGEYSVGPYKVNIWSYPEYYDDSAADNNPYINPKKIIILPENPRFLLSFAGLPHIRRDVANAEFPGFIQQTKGAFMIGNYLDERGESHVMDVKSAGIAVPVAVDQLYTAQVIV